MAKRHSRKRRKRKGIIATLLYFLVLLLIVCCLGFLYRENRQKTAEHEAQRQELMEEEKDSGASRGE